MDIVRECVKFLEVQGGTMSSELLVQLLDLIAETGSNESVRGMMASTVEVWDHFATALHCYVLLELVVDQIRILRGLVLLARNLVVSCNERSRVFYFYQQLLQLLKFEIDQPELIQNLNMASLQFLVNMTSSVSPVNVEDGGDIKGKYFEYDYKYLKEFLLANGLDIVGERCMDFLLTYLNNLFNSSEFLYNFLNDKDAVRIMMNYLNYFNGINEDAEALNNHELLILSLFQKMYLHESFIKFWNHISDDTNQLAILGNAQMILTNKDNFGGLELTTLLSWLNDLYDLYAPAFIKSLEEGRTEGSLQMKLFRILDIISNLGKFDHARKFFNHYNFLPKIGSLLHVLEKNFQRETLKDSNNKDKKLPGLKTLAIEIITFLIYQNFENQEYVREACILEIVLNNCQLDRNEPFIKERSIVCLRYLMENNMQNQEFIKQLQPEKVQISDEKKLEQMGVELDIGKDGKIQMRNKNADRIKELK